MTIASRVATKAGPRCVHLGHLLGVKRCVAGVLLASCAQGAPPARTASDPTFVESSSAAGSEPERVDRLVVTPGEALGVSELLARADREIESGRPERALIDYDRLLQAERLRGDDPLTGTERRWFMRALFGAGTAHDLLGNREEALDRYLEVERRYPETAEGRTAGVRAVRLLVHLERIEEAAPLAEKLLEAGSVRSPGAGRSVGSGSTGGGVDGKGGELGALEQVALLSALALERVAREDDVEAFRLVARGEHIVEKHGFDRSDRLPRDLAQLYFALGEVRRLRAERLIFEPPFTDFPERLERRCQLLLDAQSAYSDAMRAHDAHWSAMAGYRVGELYQKLHEDVMKVPPPEAADTEGRRALFEGAMRLRYSVLLRKASTMLAHTLAMVERTGYSTHWVDKARSARRSIERALEAEEAALERLPYSRSELQSALDRLRERATPAPDP